MLLMDGLLNFSREILPANRGGLMDAPLVLTTRLNPTEVDKEALNVDSGGFTAVIFMRPHTRNRIQKNVLSEWILSNGDSVLLLLYAVTAILTIVTLLTKGLHSVHTRPLIP